MKIKIFQVDAFTEKLFAGNPAAVCILENAIEDQQMQNIATENNLAETAFVQKIGEIYQIRWFTPTVEVDLCGHATLASAFVLFNFYEQNSNKLKFLSPQSGNLFVEKSQNGLLTLDFPQDELEEIEISQEMINCFGIKPLKAFQGKSDSLYIYENQEIIENIKPNLNQISQLKSRGVIVSAKAKEVDFVSRFFGPQVGIDEDPVTGSAHTSLTPFWAKELKKEKLKAKQLSKRGGELLCEVFGNRVKISGNAVLYLSGEITI